MKTRNIILVLSFIFFNSCVVKSLHPFYTKETVSFKRELLGKWRDNHKDSWKIFKFEEKFTEDNTTEETSDFFNKILEKYKNSFYIVYEQKTKVSHFLATPFIVNDQLFLDFIPLGLEDENLNSLFSSHLVYTHSLVKLNIKSNNTLEIKWFDEDELKNLFDENRIKIKHEKTGLLNDKILLTASSKEIQKFLKKYLATESAKKWETSTKFTLTKD